MTENYFQHADHFTRVLSEREIQKKLSDNKLSKDNEKNFLKNIDKQGDNFSQSKDTENTKVEQN